MKLAPLWNRLRNLSIRRRLLLSFVLVAMLPAIAISVGSIVVGYFNGRQQAIDRLTSVAALKDTEISIWMKNRQDELLFLLNEAYHRDRIQIVLTLAEKIRFYNFYYEATQKAFQRFQAGSADLTELAILDINGQVILSTNPEQEGRSYAGQGFFDAGLEAPYSQLWQDPQQQGQVSVVTTSPVHDMNGSLVGVLFSRASPAELAHILSDPTGMGKTGYAYLVDTNHFLMDTNILDGAPIGPAQSGISSSGIDAVLKNHQAGQQIYSNHQGIHVVGVYRWIPQAGLALMVEQDAAEAFGSVFTSLTVSIIIAVITLGVAIGASMIFARTISRPVINLAETASRIASGDLEQAAPVERGDEIGRLATAFNSMTMQLRDLINSLEKRVQERTHTLQQRALQLETSSRVSREITSILNINDLLIRIVELIREAFGYFNVHIYLVDGEKNELVLKASSGTTTQQAVLEINPHSLNGKAAVENQAVLVHHTAGMAGNTSPEHFEACTELIIPLRMGERVIGTLDVKTQADGSFTPEDVLVLQSLGDQIAIAIDNAYLYEKNRQLAVMEERNRLARDLHDSVTQSLYSLGLLVEGWRQMLANGEPVFSEERLARMAEINQQALREMRLLIHELRPPLLEEVGLLNALQKRLDIVENRAGIKARLLVDDYLKLPAHLPNEDCIYRILQEALNNALKHSRASQLTVHVSNQVDNLILEVADNGIGFDIKTAAGSGGLGMTTMSERAQSIGTDLRILSSPGQGTIVQIILPPVPAGATDS